MYHSETRPSSIVTPRRAKQYFRQARRTGLAEDSLTCSDLPAPWKTPPRKRMMTLRGGAHRPPRAASAATKPGVHLLSPGLVLHESWKKHRTAALPLLRIVAIPEQICRGSKPRRFWNQSELQDGGERPPTASDPFAAARALLGPAP